MGDLFNERVLYPDPLNRIRIWRQYKNTAMKWKWHFHHEIEIIAILKGQLSIVTKNEEIHLKAGAAAIVGSYEPHYTYKEEGEMEYIVFQFDIFEYLGYEYINLRYFTDAGRLFTKLNYILQEKPDINNRIFDYVYNIYKEYKSREKGYSIAISSMIYNIAFLLLRNDDKSFLDVNYCAEQNRFLPVLSYIENNTKDKISMEEACALVNMSYYHFGKCFKKIMGKSFKEYVNYKKILYAERFLLTTDLSVMEIAEAVGIFNKTNFYKIFHAQNGCTPSEFRKKAYHSIMQNNG